MADTKVSALTAATTPADADVLLIVNGGNSRKIDLATLSTYMRSKTGLYNASTSTQTPAANTDVLITGSTITLASPTTILKAGTQYRVEMSVTKGAAGTGTPVVNVRYGTAGSTADSSRCAFTWPAANTAIADEMKLTIQCTVRSVGSGTSAVIEGMMLAEHELTTTGFGGTALGSNIIVNTTGGGFDSTVANSILSVTINGGTASAWSFRQTFASLENLA